MHSCQNELRPTQKPLHVPAQNRLAILTAIARQPFCQILVAITTYPLASAAAPTILYFASQVYHTLSAMLLR
jgi:hypothetical protein